jgi:hypothetical protein
MAQPRNEIGRLKFEFGMFKYGSDTKRQRPTKVWGTLSNMTSTPANPPLSHFTGGDTASTYDLMEGLDQGHVIMVSCSGVSDSENIVTMYPCFNQAGGLWRELEQRISNYLAITLPTKGSQRVVNMIVEIEYSDDANDPRFPTAFLVTVTDSSSQGGHLYFKSAPLDRFRITHLPTPPATINPIGELGAEFVQLIMAADKQVSSSNWTIESKYQNPYLASLKDVPIRPYAMLDYLWLDQNDTKIGAFLTDGCIYRYQHAAEFHERQKQLIKIVNAMRNSNQLKSDYPGDTKDALIMGSGPRAAQIDHVFPYSQFGGNLFSNALIASGAFNNRQKASSPGDKWKSGGGVSLYRTDFHAQSKQGS